MWFNNSFDKLLNSSLSVVLPKVSFRNTSNSLNNIFKLYKTKLIIDDKGNDDNYYFEDDIDICCYGVQNIKTYLKNIINKIEDKNIFFVISGRLKIFDFIKVNNDIIPKIEFIDLPEFDNRSKDFLFNKCSKNFFLSNTRKIYIYEPKIIDDENAIYSTKYSLYERNSKLKKNPNNVIKMDLFLINKSDSLDDDSEKIKLKERLLYNLSLNKNEVNISFFSAKYFLEYIKVKYKYIYHLENNPMILLLDLFNEYNENFRSIQQSFKKFIIRKIYRLEEMFDLDNEEEEEDEKEPPEYFKNKLKKAINQLETSKHFLFDEYKNYDDIINVLFNFYEKFKKKIFKKYIIHLSFSKIYK